MRLSNFRKDMISIGIIATLVVSMIILFYTYGPIVGHSFTPNYNWLQAFSSQFLQGEIYPRWLYQSYQGSGSPAFYYYGPMPFWISTIASLVLCPACSPEAVFMIGPSVLMGLASISCYYFLKTISGRRIALLSSLLYFVLPYHFIVDLWIRNSWGELSSYIFTPLLLLTIKQSRFGRKYRVAAAIVYAGLLFSHLPTALLFSPMMILYACLEFGWIKGFKKAGFIVLAGSGLAAIYILPALTTQDLINNEYWAYHDPTDWLWFSGKYFISKGLIFVIIAVFSLLFILVNGRLFSLYEIKREKLLLTSLIASIYSLFLMTGLSLPLWEQVDLLNKVQFPWRVNSILDLSIVVVFALYLSRIKEHRREYFAYIAIVILSVLGIFLLFSQDLPKFFLSSKDETVSELILSGYEPAEYRTKWLAHDYPDLGYRELENILNEIPLASIINGKGDIVGLHDFGDKLTIQLNAQSNVRIRFRRFYYPGWYLVSTGLVDKKFPVELSPHYALIESSFPAGNYSITLTRHSLPEEYLGTAVSIICVFFCAFLLYRAYRNPVSLDTN